MTYTICISVDGNTRNYLEKNPFLKPSHIFRHAIRKMQNETWQRDEELQGKVMLLSDKLQKLLRYMEDRGLNYNVLEEKRGETDSKRGIREIKQENHRNCDNAGRIEVQSTIIRDGERETQV